MKDKKGLHVLPKSKIQARGTCWLRARARSGKMQTPPTPQGFKIACAFQTFHFTYFYIIVFFQKQKTKTQACKTSQILSKNEAPDPSWEPRIETSLHFWAGLEAAFSFGAFARSSEGSKRAKGAYEWVIRDRGGCWLDKRVSEEAGGSMRTPTTTTTTMTTTTKKNMVLYPGALPALWSTRIWQCHIVANNRQLSVGWLSDWSQTTWNDGKSRKQDEVHSHMWAWAGISYNNNHVDFTLSDLKIFAQRCAVKAPHASSAESTNGMKPCVIALAAALTWFARHW